jgi:hypothetical protein
MVIELTLSKPGRSVFESYQAMAPRNRGAVRDKSAAAVRDPGTSGRWTRFYPRRRHYLWGTVDQSGVALDFEQIRRNAAAGTRFSTESGKVWTVPRVPSSRTG